jgi:hypothetical protein
LKYDVIIGVGFLNNVEVNIRGKEFVISQLEDRVRNSAQIPDVFKIDAIQNSDEVDLSHIRDVENRNAIADIVQSYKLEKIREVSVKMSIILKDDIPVYQRPRRYHPLKNRRSTLK